MANENNTQNTPWPMPKFRFSVDWGDLQADISFQEVEGLETEAQNIEYRSTNAPQFSVIKMPGIAKYGNVTLKRGIFANGPAFRAWHDEITMNTIKRQTVVINLLDETDKPMMAWTLNNAWPTKISDTDFNSDGNEVAIDTLEIAHEGLTVTYAGS